ncbi:MAG: MCE family protein [Kofleriaceae bacterium]|nr:MCE family protein [Kofleriaceae bacterium]
MTATILVGGVAGVGVFAQRKMAKPQSRATFRTYVLFRDGSKIALGTPVVIAGVNVGQVDKVALEGNMARIDLRINAHVQLPVDSWATRRADSLFGDAYVEIIPGGQTDGVAAGAGQMLRSGQPITRVVEGASTDTLLRGMERALPRVNRALQVFDDATQAGRKSVSGTYEENFTSVLEWLDKDHVERPIARLAEAMRSLDDMTVRAERALAGGDAAVLASLDRIDNAITQSRTTMRDAQQQVISSLSSARDEVARLDPVIADVAEALGAAESPAATAGPRVGGPALGRLQTLLDDPASFDTIADATGEAAETVRSATSLRSVVGLRTEYNVLAGATRVVSSARIAARNDKFYLVEGTLRPQGSSTAALAQDGNGGWVKTALVEDSYVLTAQLGKRYGRFAVRGGLKESGVGVGLDAVVGNERLTFSADIFESNFATTPNVRLSATLALVNSFYLLAGVDAAFTPVRSFPISDWSNNARPGKLASLRYGRDVFVGGMLRFTDEDLLSLLTFYGSLVLGVL